MNKSKIGFIFLCVGAGVAIFTALAHVSCIFLGEECYRSQMAPEIIIRSAENGTLLAPVGTIIVSLLFLVCGLYALSAANVIVRLPLLNAAMYSISTLCILRGLATIPLAVAFPKAVGAFAIISGAIWFLTGVLFLFGFWLRKDVVSEAPLVS